jgi:Trypsin-like peptidase domain
MVFKSALWYTHHIYAIVSILKLRQNVKESTVTAISIVPMLAVVTFIGCGNVKTSTSLRNYQQTMAGPRSVSDYQIGSSWGKKQVTQAILDSESPIFKRLAHATGKVSVGFGTATAFVIGEKNGKVLMATNHHVIEDQAGCGGSRLSFEFLGLRNLACDTVITTSTDLDLTLFTLKNVTPEAKAKLLAVAKAFSTDLPRKGQKLLTIGYGVASNPSGNLMSGQDDDCKTFSPDEEIRFMADPDEFNPGPYKTWMFATGCDVSHGDSGSAIVDSETGDVVGILSTGKIPKNARVRDAAYLSDIYDSSSEDVWKELSYMVPSSKIMELATDLTTELSNQL